MAEQLALEKQQPAAMTPMDMIQMAFQRALDSGGPEALAVADRILEQMARQRAYEDEVLFNAALRRIQDKLQPVVKKGWNDQTKSHYATSDAVDKMIDPLVASEGMVLTFEPEPSPQPMMVRIVGVLSLGAYSRRYPLEMPTDGQGPKGGGVMTRTHATGSAIAYGIRYLKRMIFNLHLKDDDGNKAGGSLSDPEYLKHEENIKNAANDDELKRFYQAGLDAANSANDKESAQMFSNAKNARYRELHGAGR